GEEGMEVVGEAPDGIQAIAFAKGRRPDVIIMDITMPNLNGIDATREILKDHPDTGIIALSVHTDKHFVAIMLRAGARGYLRKDCASEELVEAVRTVVRKQIYISPNLGFPIHKSTLALAELSGFIASALLTAKER